MYMHAHLIVHVHSKASYEDNEFNNGGFELTIHICWISFIRIVLEPNQVISILLALH